MMTRKDYCAIAQLLCQARIDNDYGDPADRIIDQLESAWIELFARDNPHFSPGKFKEASNGNE